MQARTIKPEQPVRGQLQELAMGAGVLVLGVGLSLLGVGLGSELALRSAPGPATGPTSISQAPGRTASYTRPELERAGTFFRLREDLPRGGDGR